MRVLRLSPSLLGKLDFEFSFALRQNQDFQLAPSTKPTTAPSANIAIGWPDRLVDCAFEITCDLLHVLSGFATLRRYSARHVLDAVGHLAVLLGYFVFQVRPERRSFRRNIT